MWRSRLRENTGETSQTIDDTVRKHSDESQNRNRTNCHGDWHGATDVNLLTALEFWSLFASLESLLVLEQKHEMVIAISVEVFPGVLQTEQKHIQKLERSNRSGNEYQAE